MDTITTTAPGYARFDIGRLALFFSEGAVIGYGLKRRVGDAEWEDAAVAGGPDIASKDRWWARDDLRPNCACVSRENLESTLTALLEQFDLLGEEK